MQHKAVLCQRTRGSTCLALEHITTERMHLHTKLFWRMHYASSLCGTYPMEMYARARARTAINTLARVHARSRPQVDSQAGRRCSSAAQVEQADRVVCTPRRLPPPELPPVATIRLHTGSNVDGRPSSADASAERQLGFVRAFDAEVRVVIIFSAPVPHVSAGTRTHFASIFGPADPYVAAPSTCLHSLPQRRLLTIDSCSSTLMAKVIGIKCPEVMSPRVPFRTRH
eukprot:1343064-Pleurochrysis_carterae.AAC.1